MLDGFGAACARPRVDSKISIIYKFWKLMKRHDSLMTPQLVIEGGKHNIRANTISPELIEVDATCEFSEAMGIPRADDGQICAGPCRQAGGRRSGCAASCIRRKVVRAGADIAVGGGTTRGENDALARRRSPAAFAARRLTPLCPQSKNFGNI
jgi:hypothetical protein